MDEQLKFSFQCLYYFSVVLHSASNVYQSSVARHFGKKLFHRSRHAQVEQQRAAAAAQQAQQLETQLRSIRRQLQSGGAHSSCGPPGRCAPAVL